MGLFNKAREALAQAASSVSREAEYFSVQTQLGGLSTEVDRQLLEVGKRTRELVRLGQVKDQQLEILLRRVDELEAQMMELREKAQEVQNRPAAPTPPAAPAVPAAPPAPAAAVAHCAACGADLPANAKFCGACGAKIESD